MEENGIFCTDCGNSLEENERPCSNCGSKRRTYNETLTEKFSAFTGLGLKHKDKNGFVKVEEKVCDKLSGETRRPAHETIVIDRTDPDFTTKYHKVEEKDE